jgi:hypothetical protein
MANQTPMWRMPTRAEAIEILQASRVPILELIEDLEDSRMKREPCLAHLRDLQRSIKQLKGGGRLSEGGRPN